jgi:hypothetical protein
MARALRYAPKGGVRRVGHRTGSAADSIGVLRDGVHVTGVTAGQFSSIDALEHMINELGPAYAWVSTWTTGLYDVERAAELVKNERLLGVRMLLDRGTFEKSPTFAGPLIEALGVDAFRCLGVHAKVTVLVDADLQPLAAMRSSMNLNKNLRTEQFDLSVDRDVAGFYADWFEGLWDEAGVGASNAEIIKAVYDRWVYSGSFVAEGAQEADGPIDLLGLELGDV